MLKVVIDATPVYTGTTAASIYLKHLILSLRSLQTQADFELATINQLNLNQWLKPDQQPLQTSHKHTHLDLSPLAVNAAKLLDQLSQIPDSHHWDKLLGYPHIIHNANSASLPTHKSSKVTTISDINQLLQPPTHTKNQHLAARLEHNLQKSDLILTFAESTKQEIQAYLHTDTNIAVVPPASQFTSHHLPGELPDQSSSHIDYDFSQPYILCTGNIELGSNVINLAEAFNILKQQQQIEHNLLLVGQAGDRYEAIWRTIQNLPSSKYIHHFDNLPLHLIALLHSKADVCVQPNINNWEMIALLDAFTCGSPLITANTAAYSEIVGDAAIIVDPNQPREIATAIGTVINSSDIRQDLINKGREQAKLFSWQRTATETFQAYESLSVT